ncbi:MAG TPA: hypothetical protein PKM44_10830, partial [Turneriella sp.]|nr:hypothetical protein [Turneriella sp.]
FGAGKIHTTMTTYAPLAQHPAQRVRGSKGLAHARVGRSEAQPEETRPRTWCGVTPSGSGFQMGEDGSISYKAANKGALYSTLVSTGFGAAGAGIGGCPMQKLFRMR